MKRHIMPIFAALALLSLLLVGCGGDSSDEPAPVADSSSSESSSSSTSSASGEELFSLTCAPCHGPDAKGVQGLGKDLTTSEFAKEMSDADFLAFVIEGRPADHPDNTTAIEMPPRGGNPNLTDAQLGEIIAYLRTLQE
jgi:disulfide bond formation protein DsbB